MLAREEGLVVGLRPPTVAVAAAVVVIAALPASVS